MNMKTASLLVFLAIVGIASSSDSDDGRSVVSQSTIAEKRDRTVGKLEEARRHQEQLENDRYERLIALGGEDAVTQHKELLKMNKTDLVDMIIDQLRAMGDTQDEDMTRENLLSRAADLRHTKEDLAERYIMLAKLNESESSAESGDSTDSDYWPIF